MGVLFSELVKRGAVSLVCGCQTNEKRSCFQSFSTMAICRRITEKRTNSKNTSETVLRTVSSSVQACEYRSSIGRTQISITSISTGILKNAEGVPEDEENFDEAIKNVNTSLVPGKVSYLAPCQSAHFDLLRIVCEGKMSVVLFCSGD